jgi:hypothetical protein
LPDRDVFLRGILASTLIAAGVASGVI